MARIPLHKQEGRFDARIPASAGRLAAKRRRKRTILLAVSGVVFVLVIPALILLSHVPQINVHGVEVTGTTLIPQTEVVRVSEDILNAAGNHIVSRRMIINYPRYQIEAALKANFSSIETAHVSVKGLWNPMLKVAIKERLPKDVWCTTPEASDCYRLDDDGYVYEHAEKEGFYFSGGIDVAPGSDVLGKRFLPGMLTQARIIVEKLKEMGLNPVSMHMVSNTEFAVMLFTGGSVKGVLSADPVLFLSNLQAVTGAEALRGKLDQIEYIDMRFGDRVFYKLKGAPAVE